MPRDTRGARFTRSLRGQACADGLILGFEERSKRMRRSAVCSSALQSPTPTHRCPVRPIAAIALAFAPRLRRNTSDHSNGRGTTIPPSEGSRGAIRPGWRGGINPYARTEVGHPAWPSAPTSSPQRSCSIGKRLQEMVGGTSAGPGSVRRSRYGKSVGALPALDALDLYSRLWVTVAWQISERSGRSRPSPGPIGRRCLSQRHPSCPCWDRTGCS